MWWCWRVAPAAMFSRCCCWPSICGGEASASRLSHIKHTRCIQPADVPRNVHACLMIVYCEGMNLGSLITWGQLLTCCGAGMAAR